MGLSDRHGFWGDVVFVGLHEVANCRRQSWNLPWLKGLNAPIFRKLIIVQSGCSPSSRQSATTGNSPGALFSRDHEPPPKIRDGQGKKCGPGQAPLTMAVLMISSTLLMATEPVQSA